MEWQIRERGTGEVLEEFQANEFKFINGGIEYQKMPLHDVIVYLNPHDVIIHRKGEILVSEEELKELNDLKESHFRATVYAHDKLRISEEENAALKAELAELKDRLEPTMDTAASRNCDEFSDFTKWKMCLSEIDLLKGENKSLEVELAAAHSQIENLKEFRDPFRDRRSYEEGSKEDIESFKLFHGIPLEDSASEPEKEIKAERFGFQDILEQISDAEFRGEAILAKALQSQLDHELKMQRIEASQINQGV